MSNSNQNHNSEIDLNTEIGGGKNELILPETRISSIINPVVMRIGDIISWCWVLLLLVIITNVCSRYFFGQGRIEFEEIQWHIYSLGFLTGLSYCLISNDHVRVDFVYEMFSPKTKAWVELFGTSLLLLPFVGVVVYYAVPFVAYSWSLNEVSDAPGGLPARWAIKSALIFGFVLLGVSAISRITQLYAYLFVKNNN